MDMNKMTSSSKLPAGQSITIKRINISKVL